MSIAGPVQGARSCHVSSTVHGTSRRSPRPSESADTVDSTSQWTFRKSAAPVSADQRLHGSTAAAVTSAATNAAAAAAAGRVDRPRVVHPGTDQTGARATSPVSATTHRPTARSNRSSDLRMARRDTAACSKLSGQSLSYYKGAITNKIKHARKHETSPARLAQPLHNC